MTTLIWADHILSLSSEFPSAPIHVIFNHQCLLYYCNSFIPERGEWLHFISFAPSSNSLSFPFPGCHPYHPCSKPFVPCLWVLPSLVPDPSSSRSQFPHKGETGHKATSPSWAEKFPCAVPWKGPLGELNRTERNWGPIETAPSEPTPPKPLGTGPWMQSRQESQRDVWKHLCISYLKYFENTGPLIFTRTNSDTSQ